MVLINTNIRDLGKLYQFSPCTCHETCENVSYVVSIYLEDTDEINPKIITLNILCNKCHKSTSTNLCDKNYYKNDIPFFANC